MAFGKVQTKIESKPKNTAQGRSVNTKRSATSRNAAKKRYRGQGKWVLWGLMTPFFMAQPF